MSNVTKPRTTPTLLALAVALRKAGRATAAELQSNAIYMARLQDEGLVKVAGKVQSGRRGRPAHIYALTDKGRKRADRAIAKSAA